MGVIYIHGGGWRIGYKDMGTRTFFQRLVGQGHVVSDIAYTLSPQADIPTMVTEINQAILWMKEKSGAFGVNPERIVLMGASAGGHLALLAAYTPNHPAFRLFPPDTGDTSVRGVVAYYPLVDFLTLPAQAREVVNLSPNPIDRIKNVLYAGF